MDKLKRGMRLRNLREMAHETQEELSKEIGVSPQAISFYESGSRVPNDDVKIRYAKHFGCTVEEIFFEGFY